MDVLNHIELTIPVTQVRPTLRALLNAIFFHRTLDVFEPETWDIGECHIPSVPSSTIEKTVASKIEEFTREYVDTRAPSGEIAVVFLQRKPRKGWFAVTEELVPWEEHLITLHFTRDRPNPQTPPPNPLPAALLKIITFCLEKNGNVPSLTGTSENSNLSHQILVGPPSPAELFTPSPPLHPTRLTSPPPQPSLTTTPATVIAKDQTLPASSAVAEVSSAGASVASPPTYIVPSGSSGAGTGGIEQYLEQAKDGLRAVGAKAGAVAGWTQRSSSASRGV
ncbi:hypothetical protein BD324DRAFT_17534 [Kockovaella imperatae]|uniref:Autophagy-related protein 101 n=1 Tax=Kockovaella imperatae TaxID=4999 RepID=A0A1Y1URP3_9TREE|nr:hypothetical protein BD324DRAFT_17534 [Kockovaella imperatae]ORX40731.1 hypothetical protein BD324DRAFT_17534 [Kockovaella imperatae]